MKVMGMCLPEKENGAFGVGFHGNKGVIGCGIQKKKKKMGLFWCKLLTIWGHLM